jgi:hypothetical protein
MMLDFRRKSRGMDLRITIIPRPSSISGWCAQHPCPDMTHGDAECQTVSVDVDHQWDLLASGIIGRPGGPEDD